MMRRTDRLRRELTDAVISLVNDVTAMQNKTDPNWFGAFSNYLNTGGFGENEVAVEWSNLTITLDRIRLILKEMDKDQGQ